MPDDEVPPPPFENVGWGFAVLAAVVAIILLSWSASDRGRGWGRDNQLAHMMPPAAASPNDSPATRAWSPQPR
jgi:hypothetical protein